jgi:ABC-2 type transport system ATP-binding protein
MLTPEETLLFYCGLQDIPAGEREKEVRWALGAVGLLEVKANKVKTFSKGMKGRLALAQALLGRPPLIFLDEPTSGQDPLARLAIRNLILWYRDNGGTVFLNSHILTDVEKICDRVAILNRGRLVRTGSLEELERGADRLVIEAEPVSGAFLEGLRRLGKVFRAVPGGLEVEGVGREEVPGLTRMLVESGTEVYGVRLQGRSLEELFVEAVGADESNHPGF